MKSRILMDTKGRYYFIDDTSKDFHTKFGFIKKEDLKKKAGTEVINSLKNEKFVLVDPIFLDNYKRIRRGVQIMTLKDIGYIMALTGINRDSIVLDAGSGSGAVALYLSKIIKKSITYEIDDENFQNVRDNIKKLKAENIELKKGDVYEKIDEKNIDVVIFDLPEPWRALNNAKKALKKGGFLVNYSPCINSVMRLMEEFEKDDKLKESFVKIRTVDLQEVLWKVEDKSVRPINKGIGHTAFLSFFRKIR